MTLSEGLGSRILQVGQPYIVYCGYLFQLASTVHVGLLQLRVRDVSYTLQTFVSMLVNGVAFEGTVDYVSTDMRLQLRTGRPYTTCISQFVPTVFLHAQTIYKLLLVLHAHHMCCFLTGTFALYMAGRLDSRDGLTLIVALADYDTIPILRWLMQTPTTPSFTINDTFQFLLIDNLDAERDLYHYYVSCDHVTFRVSVLGIDTDRLCGPMSNVDLVHIVCEDFMRFTYKRECLGPHTARRTVSSTSLNVFKALQSGKRRVER